MVTTKTSTEMFTLSLSIDLSVLSMIVMQVSVHPWSLLHQAQIPIIFDLCRVLRVYVERLFACCAYVTMHAVVRLRRVLLPFYCQLLQRLLSGRRNVSFHFLVRCYVCVHFLFRLFVHAMSQITPSVIVEALAVSYLLSCVRARTTSLTAGGTPRDNKIGLFFTQLNL